MRRVIRGAIRQFLEGDWDASTGEVEHGILVIRPAMRRDECCGEPLEPVAEAREGSFTWGLWRCRVCRRSYSIGPKLPPAAWVSALAEKCIRLYLSIEAERKRNGSTS